MIPRLSLDSWLGKWRGRVRELTVGTKVWYLKSDAGNLQDGQQMLLWLDIKSCQPSVCGGVCGLKLNSGHQAGQQKDS